MQPFDVMNGTQSRSTSMNRLHYPGIDASHRSILALEAENEPPFFRSAQDGAIPEMNFLCGKLFSGNMIIVPEQWACEWGDKPVRTERKTDAGAYQNKT